MSGFRNTALAWQRLTPMQERLARILFNAAFGPRTNGERTFANYLATLPSLLPNVDNYLRHNLLVLVDPSFEIFEICELLEFGLDLRNQRLVDRNEPGKTSYWIWANDGGLNRRHTLYDARARLVPGEQMLSAVEGLFLAVQHHKALKGGGIVLDGSHFPDRPDLIPVLELFGSRPTLHAVKRSGAYTHSGAGTRQT